MKNPQFVAHENANCFVTIWYGIWNLGKKILLFLHIYFLFEPINVANSGLVKPSNNFTYQ